MGQPLAQTLKLLLVWTLALSVLFAAGPASAQRPTPAPVPDRVPPRPVNKTACNYQEPQAFLQRHNFMIKARMSKEERRERNKIHQRSIEYRTKQYGYFEGFGQRAWNPRSTAHNATAVTFMGLKTRLNKRLVPVLECVEQQINEECSSTPYSPKRLSGLRDKNTYHNNEVSNHVYGIGLDVDPTLNTCCGCVGRWAEHRLCKQKVSSIYDRMAMPECWVHSFERFGFYWLGWDRLQDTMHFEFLGDPNHILKSSGPPEHGSAAEDAGAASASGADAGAATGDAAPLAPAAGDGGAVTTSAGDGGAERPTREPTLPEEVTPAENSEACGCVAVGSGEAVGPLARVLLGF